jgi:riboflavin synthase
MFTGLIETMGTLRRVVRRGRSTLLGVEPDAADFTVAIGGSVAIDGVCLTCERSADGLLFFTAVAETLDTTTHANAQSGNRVNLERALRVDGRFDGHIVLGHVDGVGEIAADTPRGDSLMRTFRIPADLQPFVAAKGSIAIDGISLTIAACEGALVTVSLIPHTLRHTSMEKKLPGARVNIECDILARYIFQLVAPGRTASPSHISGGETLLTMMENNQF